VTLATEDNGFTDRGVVHGLRLGIAPHGEQLLEKGLIDFSASQRSPAIVGNREKAVANAGQAARYAGSCVGVISKGDRSADDGNVVRFAHGDVSRPK